MKDTIIIRVLEYYYYSESKYLAQLMGLSSTLSNTKILSHPSTSHPDAESTP